MEHKIEWISVEDRLPGKELVLCTDGKYCFENCIHDMDDVTEDGVTYWMALPEPPQPKAPTFKDVFLEKFPGARMVDDRPSFCVRVVFPYLPECNFDPYVKLQCKKCWNQPYFEEEGGE